MSDYYNQLREVAEVRYDDGLEMDSIRKTHEGLQRCRENAEAFRRNYALTGQTGQAVEGWLQRYHDVINIREQVLRQQVEVHERAREHMRQARDQFHALGTDLVSEFERAHFQEHEVFVIEGHEVTGDAYIAALAAQRQQEREDKARTILTQMDTQIAAEIPALDTRNPLDDLPSGDVAAGGGARRGRQIWSGSEVALGGATGAAATAGVGGRVSGVEPLPGDTGAGGSGIGGSESGGVAPMPSDDINGGTVSDGRRPYVRPPAPGRPGSAGYPISNPADLVGLPLTTSPVFSDGMDGGYVPPSVANASDPRWNAGSAGVALQSGVAVGSVAAMGGGLLASRGGGPGVSGTNATGGGVGRGGYGVVPAGGVIGRPAPGTPGSGASGAGGPVVAGVGAPGAEGSGARSGRGSLQSSLAQAKAAVARAAGTSTQPSAPVIKPSEGNTGMISAGQGGRGKDEEERRRRRGYTVPKLDKPDDHQHDPGHWAFGAGSAGTLPPVPRTRDDSQW